MICRKPSPRAVRASRDKISSSRAAGQKIRRSLFSPLSLSLHRVQLPRDEFDRRSGEGEEAGRRAGGQISLSRAVTASAVTDRSTRAS